MHLNEPMREHILRNLENAIDRLNDDFERVEFWAAALNAFMEPIPSYESAHGGYLLPGRNDRAGGSAGALRGALSGS